MATIRQVQTTTKSARGVMASKAFGEGFRDAREGRAFRYDYSTHTDTQWAYERGRILACYFDGPLKINRSVNRMAIFAVGKAMQEGVML